MSTEISNVDEGGFVQKMRRGSKKAVRVCLMVAGQSGLGKSTFLHKLTKTPFANEKTMEISKFTVGNNDYPYIPRHLFLFAILEFESNSGQKVIVDAIDTPGYDDENSAEKRYTASLAGNNSLNLTFLKGERNA